MAALLLRSLGWATWRADGPTEEAERYFEEAAQLQWEIGALAEYAYSLTSKARTLAWREGNLAASRPMLEEALTIASEYNHSYIRAAALAALATHQLIAGEHEAVLASTEEILALEQKMMESWCEANLQRGIVFLATGDLEDAIPFMMRALSYQIEAASPTVVTYLPYCSVLLARLGEYERAVELLALGLTSSYRRLLELDPLLTRTRSQLEKLLGEERFAAAWERGRHLEVRTAATEVLAELESLR